MVWKINNFRKIAKSVIKLKTTIYKQYRILADIGDDNLLSEKSRTLMNGKNTELWDYVRNYIDETSGKGLFILTIAKPIEDKERHSGIGRMKKSSCGQ